MGIEEEIKQIKFRSEKQKATINLLYTAGWISNSHKHFFKEFGITPQQFNVLRILRGQHPKSISTSDIKARMMDKNSDVSRIVDRLAAKHWISKTTCPKDKRLVDVIITDKGMSLLAGMDSTVDELDDVISLTNDEAAQLNHLLDKLRKTK